MLIDKFDEAATSYIADMKTARRSELTVKKYERIISAFRGFIPIKGMGILSQNVATDSVLNYKLWLTKKNLSANTIAQYLIALRTFFQWCITHKLFSSQPVEPSLIPEMKEPFHDIPSIKEISSIMEQTPPSRMWTKNSARNNAIVKTLLLSGMRVSELCSLKVCDCNFEAEVIHVVCGKGRKQRYAPFPPSAINSVKAYVSEREKTEGRRAEPFAPLFVNDDGEALTRQGISRIVEMYVKRLTGHEGITAHDLRHAAASLWDDKGIPIRTVQKALGHSNVRTTEKIYIQVLAPAKAAEEISHAFS